MSTKFPCSLLLRIAGNSRPSGANLGVTLFQEQILKIAMEMAGFSGSEADELRRAMAFKRSDERMREVTEKLHTRMTERGVSKETQAKVIQAVGSFALYGFPESHAISFAFLAYASCYLKSSSSR